MPIEFAPMEQSPINNKLTVFLSGSIPDPARWEGAFNALEITDAVVSLARACLTRGYRIVTAAHPTLAPLLLYVAAEFPRSDQSRVLIYQSLLFEDVLPTATRRFEAAGVGEVIWTAAAEGERPVPGQWHESLRLMRKRMLKETKPAAATFIGGMSGIDDEFALFREIFPNRPTYAVSRPGGAASGLPTESTGRFRTDLQERLRTSDTYPALWQEVLGDIERRTQSLGNDDFK